MEGGCRSWGAQGRAARGLSSSEPAGMVGGGGEEIVGWEGKVRTRERERLVRWASPFFLLFFRMDGWMDPGWMGGRWEFLE